MQNPERVGVTRKILWNKDLAAVVDGGGLSGGWEVGKSGRCFGVCMRSRRRGTQIPSSSSEEILGDWMRTAIGRRSRRSVIRQWIVALFPPYRQKKAVERGTHDGKQGGSHPVAKRRR